MQIFQRLISFLSPITIKCFNPTQTKQLFIFYRRISLHQQQKNFQQNNITSFETLLNPIRSITQLNQFFAGFKFEISMPLSQYFSLGHSWLIPNSIGRNSTVNNIGLLHPTYSIKTQYVGDIKKNEANLILSGTMDSKGKLQALLIKKINAQTTFRLSGIFPNSNVDQGVIAAELDFEKKHDITKLKLMHGLINISHMQKIRNLLIGFDYSNLIHQKISVLNYGLKFKHQRHNFYFQYMSSQSLLNLGYENQIQKGIRIVSNFTNNIKENKTTAIIGLHKIYSLSEILFNINSRGKISTVLIINNKTQPYSLKLCSVINYQKEIYRFGYGISLGHV